MKAGHVSTNLFFLLDPPVISFHPHVFFKFGAPCFHHFITNIIKSNNIILLKVRLDSISLSLHAFSVCEGFGDIVSRWHHPQKHHLIFVLLSCSSSAQDSSEPTLQSQYSRDGVAIATCCLQCTALIILVS